MLGALNNIIGRKKEDARSDKSFPQVLESGDIAQLEEYLAQQSGDSLSSPICIKTGSTIWHLASEQPAAHALLCAYMHFSKTASPEALRSALAVQDKQGRTPLLRACQRGRPACVAKLLEWGADPTVHQDRKGRSAIHFAASCKNDEIIRMLFAWNRNRPTVQLSMQPTASDSTECSTHSPTPISSDGTLDGGTAPGSPVLELMLPSLSSPSSPPCVPCTPESRLMASLPDQCGLTPLHYAAMADAAANCVLLMQQGASLMALSTADCYDKHMPCNQGMTPLHVAAMFNSFHASSVMLSSWSLMSVDEKVSCWTPGSKKSASSTNIDPRAVLDKTRKTACMIAANRGFEALADLLDPSQAAVGLDPGLPTSPADEVPDMMRCPITQDIMIDPVVASDGFTYERSAIQKWIAKRGTSPMSNLLLAYKVVYPNHVVKKAIQEWCDEKGLPAPSAAIKRHVNRTGAVFSRGLANTCDGFLQDATMLRMR
mmetsp:Transcript_8626/g.18330  ORF Transcript_8626/g.18330 Transcript_8626/m.18330 type:complete len:486 (+) Transcript_8626:43-1500(+)|eukprot:CAMPEP_0202894920 /NCGR_PEP_ID=MMETSP1392-20130828/4215_1 /ASSEMBLY_ACC=CAM_ASM_000868 /TAXON_ID=225041 /ORGANISM="Chlamydomonas chlamydogama, Strain SAG 11-48b" /LENGTH=485 /DNA_ID=CAMNT_0049579761 /DNA_START=35 /DNA_END=1492 /DNA_ORIENTATION=-